MWSDFSTLLSNFRLHFLNWYNEASGGILIHKTPFLMHDNRLDSVCSLHIGLVNRQLLNLTLNRIRF